MPKTKFQGFIFSIIMVFVMVYCMTLYNISLETGLKNSTFLQVLMIMWIEFIIAFLIHESIVGPIVKKLVFKLFTPSKDAPIFITIAMGCFNVLFMAPIMTLLVSIIRNGFSKDILIIWLPKLILNFPFALFLQLFFAGPFVRFIFKLIFKNQEVSNDLKLLQNN